MTFSQFGEKFTAKSGILQLMDDLGNALSAGGNICMLGGGNPAHIPAVQSLFRQRMEAILATPNKFEHMIGDYDPPQGNIAFRQALATLLQRTYGWPVGVENIALTNGSQTAFFFLFNLLAGQFNNGQHKKILLPLTPEYIGYADLGLSEDIFIASKPEIEFLDNHSFKYHVDFNSLNLSDDIAAICVSRPTNPTGNVLTDEEVQGLLNLATAHHIPFIIDGAYGTPFPEIIFSQATPIWNENIVLCLSLSKLGLPATRTGIVIGPAHLTEAIASLNAISNLTPGGLGASLVLDLVNSGDIISLSHNLIKPYYHNKAEQAIAWFKTALAGTDFFIHKAEGAFFLWLWFRDLPISSAELYRRLKEKGVIVVPGHYFFPGLLAEDWPHRHECIRVSYAQPEAVVQRGISLIGETVQNAYQQG